MKEIKHAIILVAGEGKRLRPFTEDNPKCFVRVNGKRILENTLNALAGNGCEDVIIVIGHHADLIQKTITNKFAGMNINYVRNDSFQTTNSMYSLLLGLDGANSATWILEGDVYFDPQILNLERGREISWYVDSSTRDLDGAYVESDANGKASSLQIIRDLSLLNQRQNKSVGILSLGEDGLRNFREWLQEGVVAKRVNDYYDLILGDHMADYCIDVVDVTGHRWFEVDTPDDLEKANRLFQDEV